MHILIGIVAVGCLLYICSVHWRAARAEQRRLAAVEKAIWNLYGGGRQLVPRIVPAPPAPPAPPPLSEEDICRAKLAEVRSRLGRVC